MKKVTVVPLVKGDGSSLIKVRGKKLDTLYRIEVKICRGEVNALENFSIELWHKKLGHMSKKGLELLTKK